MKYYFSLLLVFCSLATIAQKPKVKNLQKFDQKIIHFGFALGVNSGGFALQRNAYNPRVDSLQSINVVNQSGFNLGIVSDLHITPLLNIRFLPTLVFGQRNMEFNLINFQGLRFTELRQIESTYLDFPLLVKYRSARVNNFAAYLIAGAKYSLDLASNERVKNVDIPESIIKLKRDTYSAEVGIGTDFFLPYFKLGLELKMSYSLGNAMIRDNTELSNPIEEIRPKMFFFTILFEG
ncbi:PorT family protein [Vicingaceae bacterium]|nr:PorT family protein [Vicingaceae bacterium]MDB9963908.1 PorT family protein [Vicingaceae bacterium]MDC1451176.1 PorT family protein [Vicingaceae bacterium]